MNLSPGTAAPVMLPDEIYAPETLQAISMISMPSIGDDDDFQSPRDCKKLLLLDIKDMDNHDGEKGLSEREKRNSSSLPIIIQPHRKRSGADTFTDNYRSIVEPYEEDGDSDSEESALHEPYDDDDLERSKRQKRNSSIPIIKPQRKRSGDLLTAVQKQQQSTSNDRSIIAPREEDGDSDSEESALYEPYDDDDLERSKRQKRNSSIPAMKPQRKRSVDLLTAVQQQQQQQSTSNNRDIIEGQEENGDSDSEESALHETYDDDALERSRRQKINSSIPAMKPRRRKSGVDLSDSDDESSVHEETYDDDALERSRRQKINSSIPAMKPQRRRSGDLDLSKREKRNSSTPITKPRRKKSGKLFSYFRKKKQSSTNSHGDLPEQAVNSNAVDDLKCSESLSTHSPNTTAPRWSATTMAGLLLHKPLRKSSMRHRTTPIRSSSTPIRHSISRSTDPFSQSERSQHSNDSLNIKRWLGPAREEPSG